MALRFVEVTVPDADLPRLRTVVEPLPLVDLWTCAGQHGRGTARILVDAGHAERLTDALTKALGHTDSYRLVVLPVEATLPPIPEPEPTSTAAEAPPVEVPVPGRISREELYEDVASAAALTPVFITMVALSTIVAAVGLIRGDMAIVIGAMVIAPLLGPNIALSLACTLGDVALARRSLRAVTVGVAVAAALSLAMGMLFAIDPASSEIARRTHVGIEDVALALAAGAAGALAFTTGVPAVVVGVMVAVALLPPLVVTGLLVGAGFPAEAFEAFILVVANVTCLNLAAVATFLVQKVRPRTWWEAERARKATRLAVTTWVVMLAVLVLLILLRGHRPV